MVDSKKLIGALVDLHAVARVDRDEDYAAVTNAETVIAEAKATMCRFGQCSGSGWHEDNPVYGPCDCQRQEASELEQKASESLMFLRNRLANDEPAWRALCDVMAGMLDPAPTRATAAPVVVGEDMVLVSRKETIELLAEAIYDQWKDDPNYVPWRKGGNSDKQYAARDIARTVLSLATMTAALAGQVSDGDLWSLFLKHRDDISTNVLMLGTDDELTAAVRAAALAWDASPK